MPLIVFVMINLTIAIIHAFSGPESMVLTFFRHNRILTLVEEEMQLLTMIIVQKLIKNGTHRIFPCAKQSLTDLAGESPVRRANLLTINFDRKTYLLFLYPYFFLFVTPCS
jgi:hypothetical protein